MFLQATVEVLERSKQVQIGTKRSVAVTSRETGETILFPGVQITEATLENVVTSRGNTIRSFFAEVLTLRTPNPTGPNAGGDPYYVVTPENLRFAPMRFSNVPGIDFDAETGEMLGLERLVELQTQGIIAQQQRRLSATAPAALAVDLAELAGDAAPA